MATIDELVVEIKADTGNIERGLKGVKGSLASTEKSADRLRSSIIGLAAGFVSFQAVSSIGKSLVDTITKFEKLEASLKTVTGSVGDAEKAFGGLQDFASSTPFQLEEVVGAFIKLKALGLDPTEASLTSFGNTASAMGKSLNQVIEAVADASTFEFERLKEFGIRAKQQADTVIFTFQGVKTEVGKNSEDIQDFLKGIGDVNFGGAMEEQAETLNVALSNAGDDLSKLAKAIGDAGFTDMSLEFVSAFSSMTKSVTEFFGSFERTDERTLDILKGEMNALQAMKDVLEQKVADGGLLSFLDEDALERVNEQLKEKTDVFFGLLEQINEAKQSSSDGGGGDEKDAFSILGIDIEKMNVELEALRDSFKTKEEIELEHSQNRLAQLQEHLNTELELTSAQRTLLEDLEQTHAEKIAAIKDKKLADDKKKSQDELNQKGRDFRSLLSQASSQNKLLFEVNKAAALAEAVLGARASIAQAYDFGVKVSGGNPVVGAITAGIAAAATAANIASIASSSFSGGGSSGGSAPTSGSIPDTESANGFGGGGEVSSSQTVNINVDADALITPRMLIESINQGLEDGNRIMLNGEPI